jgi:hypothetical protein
VASAVAATAAHVTGPIAGIQVAAKATAPPAAAVTSRTDPPLLAQSATVDWAAAVSFVDTFEIDFGKVTNDAAVVNPSPPPVTVNS